MTSTSRPILLSTHDKEVQRYDALVLAWLVVFTPMHGFSPAVPGIPSVAGCGMMVQEIAQAEDRRKVVVFVFNMIDGLVHLKHLRPLTSTLPFRSAGSRESLPWYTSVHLHLFRVEHRSQPRLSTSGCRVSVVDTLEHTKDISADIEPDWTQEKSRLIPPARSLSPQRKGVQALSAPRHASTRSGKMKTRHNSSSSARRTRSSSPSSA
ncbi:hypothetical protein EDB85DRAFT_2145703 [Lactarius pseudohatsudake]|nr:hypothetical protein EDB85DRAFT_2145703 [Lactarius pseudohatsudake]